MVETDSGWVGMFCVEASEVLFTDRIHLDLDALGAASCTLHSLLPKIVQPGSLEVQAAIGRMGPCGAYVDGDRLIVRAGVPNDRVTVTVQGVRKGMPGRFRLFPPRVAEANNQFWSQAWKGRLDALPMDRGST